MIRQMVLDVVEVLDVLVLPEVVERCLEGIEDVANLSDVEHVVDDVLQSRMLLMCILSILIF